MARILLETHIQAPPERVFDLARNVSLHEQSASKTNERAVGGVTKGLVGLGDTVTWRARHFGVWQELTVQVTEFDSPKLFADKMIRGAFKSMSHVHRFEEDGEGTRMTDDFRFEAPLGPLGKLAEVLFLARYMRSFLLARNRFLKDTAEKAPY